jgi:uncharacterized iron-regulated membrane protein
VGAGTAAAPPYAVARSIAAVRATGGEVTRVMVQGNPARAYRVFAVRNGETSIVVVDAASGAVLDETPSGGGGKSPAGLIRATYKLHQQLLLGESGETLVGISGLFLFATLIIGLKMGWPARGQFRSTLVPRLAKRPRLKLQQLHRSDGLWIAIPVLLSAITGTAMLWSDSLRGVLPVAPAQAEPDLRGAAVISPEAAISAAQAALPRADFSRIDLPSTGAHGFVVHLRQPGEMRAILGNSRVLVDGRTARVIHVRDATAMPWGDRLLDALVAIHNGEWLGLAGRIVTLIGGIALLALAASGLVIWSLAPRRHRAPPQVLTAAGSSS